VIVFGDPLWRPPEVGGARARTRAHGWCASRVVRCSDAHACGPAHARTHTHMVPRACPCTQRRCRRFITAGGARARVRVPRV
jgi:hypothetical protein